MPLIGCNNSAGAMACANNSGGAECSECNYYVYLWTATAVCPPDAASIADCSWQQSTGSSSFNVSSYQVSQVTAAQMQTILSEVTPRKWTRCIDRIAEPNPSFGCFLNATCGAFWFDFVQSCEPTAPSYPLSGAPGAPDGPTWPPGLRIPGPCYKPDCEGWTAHFQRSMGTVSASIGGLQNSSVSPCDQAIFQCMSIINGNYALRFGPNTTDNANCQYPGNGWSGVFTNRPGYPNAYPGPNPSPCADGPDGQQTGGSGILCIGLSCFGINATSNRPQWMLSLDANEWNGTEQWSIQWLSDGSTGSPSDPYAFYSAAGACNINNASSGAMAAVS